MKKRGEEGGGYLYSARTRKIWLQHVNTDGAAKAGVNGAGVSDVVQAGVVMAGSSGALLLEADIISLSSKDVASASEICAVFEPIKLCRH